MLSSILRCCIGAFLVLLLTLGSGGASLAAGRDASTGALLFEQNCAGCHLNGGNIIRRGKNLKLATLQRQGLDSTDAIANIARNGIGQMSGYSDQLGEGGDQLVAAWILEQAQNAWIQG